MSRPGRVMAVTPALTPPAGLCAASAAVLLALVDGDTPLAIDAGLAEAAEWIGFHCGPPLVALDVAEFVLAAALPDLAALSSGSDECPERSATVILQVAALGRGRAFTLAGPGLKAPERFEADGLPADFAACWAANHALYPRGVDLILCAGNTLAALPRSVAVGEG
jgi:alpha-D-ribose 1-methylphosphonate 5-triphosphate synthase subunit PhnH